MRGTIFGIALASVLLVGCGGGGGDSTPSGDTGATNTTQTLGCLTKVDEKTVTFRCDTSCHDDEIEFTNHYYSMSACEEETSAIIAKISGSGDTPKNADLQAGFDYLNSLRLGIGIHPLRYNSLLEEASGNHEKYNEDVYAKYNVWVGHYESKSQYPSDYFTGVEPWDRASYVGYKGSVTEVITRGYHSSTKSIMSLMTAIYHRHALIDTLYDEFGSGGTDMDSKIDVYSHLPGLDMTSDIVTTKLLGLIAPDIVFYPYNGETNVSTSYTGNENPDPLSGTNQKASGNPISFIFDDDKCNDVAINSFKLYDETNGGSEVTNTMLLSYKNDPNKRFDGYEYALFPMDFLKSGHVYRVEVKYSANGQDGEKVWSFTTR